MVGTRSNDGFPLDFYSAATDHLPQSKVTKAALAMLFNNCHCKLCKNPFVPGVRWGKASLSEHRNMKWFEIRNSLLAGSPVVHLRSSTAAPPGTRPHMLHSVARNSEQPLPQSAEFVAQFLCGWLVCKVNAWEASAKRVSCFTSIEKFGGGVGILVSCEMLKAVLQTEKNNDWFVRTFKRNFMSVKRIWGKQEKWSRNFYPWLSEFLSKQGG